MILLERAANTKCRRCSNSFLEHTLGKCSIKTIGFEHCFCSSYPFRRRRVKPLEILSRSRPRYHMHTQTRGGKKREKYNQSIEPRAAANSVRRAGENVNQLLFRTARSSMSNIRF